MKKSKSEKSVTRNGYTSTEVGAMLENMDKNIQLIAEGHGDLNKKLERIEVEVHGNSRRLDMLELRAGATSGKVSHIEDAISKLGKDLEATRKELKEDIHNLGQRLTTVES